MTTENDTSGHHHGFCAVCGGLLLLDQKCFLGMHPSCAAKYPQRNPMTPHESRERILFERAGACIKNWQFDCGGCLLGTRPLSDAERHMLQHQITRQIHFSEYETARLLRLCLYACKIALALEKDSDTEKDDLGEDYFHVKMLKEAIEAAKDGGF